MEKLSFDMICTFKNKKLITWYRIKTFKGTLTKWLAFKLVCCKYFIFLKIEAGRNCNIERSLGIKLNYWGHRYQIIPKSEIKPLFCVNVFVIFEISVFEMSPVVCNIKLYNWEHFSIKTFIRGGNPITYSSCFGFISNLLKP